MARVVVYSMAHRGDVFPFVPVADELAARGHEVTFVLPPEFHPLLERERFECRSSGTDFSPIELDRHGAFIKRWGRRLGGGVVLRLYLERMVVPNLPTLHAAIDDALSGADLLVTHPAASLVGRSAAEVRGIPWVVGDLFPMLVPTADHPPSALPFPRGTTPRRRAMNRFAWRFGASNPAARWATSEQAFRDFRAGLGLTTERGFAITGRLSPHLNLGLVSPAYYPRHTDMPDHYVLTGFSHWHGPRDYEVASDIAAFLDRGERPVLVTLGTSAASAAPEVFTLVAGALDLVGLRGLFLVSNDDNARRLAGREGVWSFAPLAPLLEHCRAVLHSGAHGTNALVLEAGLPSVIVPQLFDQVWHGQRVAELGAGVCLSRLSTRRLAEAIDLVTRDQRFAAAARDIASEFSVESGPARAVDEIERLLAA